MILIAETLSESSSKNHLEGCSHRSRTTINFIEQVMSYKVLFVSHSDFIEVAPEREYRFDVLRIKRTRKYVMPCTSNLLLYSRRF